jgi:protein phosphatase
MPLMNHNLDIAAITDTGLTRTVNEDFYQINKSLGFFLVADGMGGHTAGDVASRMAVTSINNTLKDYLTTDKPLSKPSSRFKSNYHHSLLEYSVYQENFKKVINKAVIDANNLIYTLNRKRKYQDGTGMGTAFAGLCLLENGQNCMVFHVGDCRVYLYRNGIFRQLTQDHTLYQLLKESGKQELLPGKNIILRAIGPWPQVDVEIHVHTMQADDVFLICTDGLTAMLNDAQILGIIQDQQCLLQQRCEKLVATANAAGGFDNITAVLIRLDLP